MIRNLPQCSMRKEQALFGESICSHSSNSHLVATINNCFDCPLADHGVSGFSMSQYHGSIQGELSGTEPRELSLWGKTKRLAEGAVGVTKAALGIDPASQETREARWDVCKSCDQNDLGECKACGCWIAPKISLKSQSCPISLWGPQS